MEKLTIASKRKIALSAARSQLERSGFSKHDIERTLSCDAALAALDDLLRLSPDTIAAQWYSIASDNQIKLFRREWNIYQSVFRDIDDGYKSLDNLDFDSVFDTIQQVSKGMKY